MRRSSTRTQQDFVVKLPRGVASRIVFQCGPSGQDPLADVLEAEFKCILAEDPSNGTIIVKGGDAHAVEARISEWVCQLKNCEFRMSDSTHSVVMAAIQDEVTHFIRNFPWICSAQLVGEHSVVITGCEIAVRSCSSRLRNSLVHLNVEFDEISKPFSVAPAAPEEEAEPHEIHRFAGLVKIPSMPSYLTDEGFERSPHVAVSIFDSFDFGGSSVKNGDIKAPLRKLVFTRKLRRVEKIQSVPEQVVQRMQSVIGVGCKIIVAHDKSASVTIHLSSSEADLDAAEAIVRACASRRHAGGAACTELALPVKISKEVFQKLETQFNVLLVGTEVGVLILAMSDLSRKRCEFELMKRVELERPFFFSNSKASKTSLTHTDEELGARLSAKGKQADLICRRSATASGAAVSLIGQVLFLGGEEENRELAVKCVKFLGGFDDEEVDLGNCRISLPVKGDSGRKARKALDAVETKWSCIVDKGHVSDTSFSVISKSAMNRAGAAVDLLALYESDFDNFSQMKNSWWEDLRVISCQIDVSAKKIESVCEALRVHARKIFNKLVVISGDSLQRVEAAAELLNRLASKPFNAAKFEMYTYRLELDRRQPLCSESIGFSIGCVCFFDKGIVEVVSASVLRRELCTQIVSAANPEDELDSVTGPWRSYNLV